MPSLVPSWDLAPVAGKWVTSDLSTLRAGSYKVELTRAVSLTDDVIVPAGVFAEGQLQVDDPAKPSFEVNIPVPRDPDNLEDVTVTVTVTLEGAKTETYVLRGAAPEGGYDFARLVPTGATLTPATSSLKLGVPGGVALLNGAGQVVDAAGKPVGSGSGTVDDKALASRNLLDLNVLNPLSSAFAAVDTEPVDIYVLGDSTSEGMGASSVAKTWPVQLVEQLRALYPVAQGGPTWVPAFWDSYSLPHTSWTFTGGVADSYGAGIGQRYVVLDGTKTASLTFTGTRVDIYHLAGDGIGWGKWRIDGGEWTQFAPGTGPFSATGVVPIVVDRGQHKLDIAWDGGNGVYLEGAAVYDGDEAKGIRLWNGSKYGSTTKEWADWSAGFTYFDDRIRVIHPRVFFLATVLNDIGNGVPVADFKAAYDALITRVTANAPGVIIPCLIPPVPTKELAGRQLAAPVEDYFTALRQVVAKHDNAFVVDARAWLPDQLADGSDPLELWYADGVHPSERAYTILADRVARLLTSGLRAAAPRGLSASDRGRPGGIATLGDDGRQPVSQVAQSVLDRLQGLEDAPPPPTPPTPAITQPFDFTGSSMSSGSASKLYRVPMTGKIDKLFVQQDAPGSVDTILDIERFNAGTSSFDPLYTSTKARVPAGQLLATAAAPDVSTVAEGDLLRLRVLQAPPAAKPSTNVASLVARAPYGEGTTVKNNATYSVPMPSGGQDGDLVLAILQANASLTTPLPDGWKTVSTLTTTPNARMTLSLVAAPWTASMEGGTVSFAFSSQIALLGDPLLLRNVGIDDIGQIVYTDPTEQTGAGSFTTPAFTTSADADLLIYFCGTHFPASVDGYRQTWTGGPAGLTKLDGLLTNLGSTSFDWGLAVGTANGVPAGTAVPAATITLSGGSGSLTNVSHLAGVIAVHRKAGTVGPTFITPILTIKAV